VVLAVPDDIVIRIMSRGGQSILDMRSQSRYGTYDLGRNQRRILAFLDDLISQNIGVERVKADEPLFIPGKRFNVEPEPAAPPMPEEEIEQPEAIEGDKS
jgi:hypothetical protein